MRARVKRLWGLVLLAYLSMISDGGRAQGIISFTNKLLSFTNLQGRVFHNVQVLYADVDGLVWRLPDSADSGRISSGRVAYINLSPSVRENLGVPTNRIAVAYATVRNRAAVKRAVERGAYFDGNQQEKGWLDRIATGDVTVDSAIRIIDSLQPFFPNPEPRPQVEQKDIIASHRRDLDPITKFDFPKSRETKHACKEIVSELKGVKTALELGISYIKFSDLLTDKVLSVEKIKDLRGEGLPSTFTRRVNDCVYAFKESKHWWNERIESKSEGVTALCDYDMREYWSKAELSLLYCTGIAEESTEVNEEAEDLVAKMVRTELDTAKEGILPDTGPNSEV